MYIKLKKDDECYFNLDFDNLIDDNINENNKEFSNSLFNHNINPFDKNNPNNPNNPNNTKIYNNSKKSPNTTNQKREYHTSTVLFTNINKTDSNINNFNNNNEIIIHLLTT